MLSWWDRHRGILNCPLPLKKKKKKTAWIASRKRNTTVSINFCLGSRKIIGIRCLRKTLLVLARPVFRRRILIWMGIVESRWMIGIVEWIDGWGRRTSLWIHSHTSLNGRAKKEGKKGMDTKSDDSPCRCTNGRFTEHDGQIGVRWFEWGVAGLNKWLDLAGMGRWEMQPSQGREKNIIDTFFCQSVFVSAFPETKTTHLISRTVEGNACFKIVDAIVPVWTKSDLCRKFSWMDWRTSENRLGERGHSRGAAHSGATSVIHWTNLKESQEKIF